MEAVDEDCKEVWRYIAAFFAKDNIMDIQKEQSLEGRRGNQSLILSLSQFI